MSIKAAFLCSLISFSIAAQPGVFVTGSVHDMQGNPIENALLLFQPAGKPVYTDSLGFFRMERPPQAAFLIVSAPGYLRDTLRKTENIMSITLRTTWSAAQEILVTGERNPGQTSFRSASLQINIDRQEMRKAACCNLSESFETSPLVDVSFPDPVSGIRQIQMMGLGGQYTGYSLENQMDEAGVLGSLQAGLIPGPWLESIQVQKGIGAVSSGSGMLAGQINAGFLKADTGSPVVVNGYLSDMGRAEANLVLPLRRNPGGGTQLFFHTNTTLLNIDRNGDGYRDLPLGLQLNGMIRTQHSGKNGAFLQLAARAYRDQRKGGDVGFNEGYPTEFKGFGFLSEVTGLELSGKAGKVFPVQNYRSLGVPWSAGYRINRQEAGQNGILMEEKWLRAEPVFQADLGKGGNGIKAGISLLARERAEHFKQINYSHEFHFPLSEQRAGTFLEGSFIPFPGLLLVAGYRMDISSYYSIWHSPRIHLRYEHPSGLVFRLGAGQSWQEPWIFAQNLQQFYSGRKLEIVSSVTGLPYGLKAERGRSLNFSTAFNYRILPGKGSILLDLFASVIQDQVIADVEKEGLIRIYNSGGNGESQGAGIQLDQKLGRRFSVRMAWRYAASWLAYEDQTRMRALHSFHRAMLNIDFFLGRNFQLNSGLQIHGRKRLYGSSAFSPLFPVWNLQISKIRENRFELALGVENLLDFRQQDLVQYPDSSMNPGFDAARIWGPAVGRMVYMNVRFMLK